MAFPQWSLPFLTQNEGENEAENEAYFGLILHQIWHQIGPQNEVYFELK